MYLNNILIMIDLTHLYKLKFHLYSSINLVNTIISLSSLPINFCLFILLIILFNSLMYVYAYFILENITYVSISTIWYSSFSTQICTYTHTRKHDIIIIIIFCRFPYITCETHVLSLF